MGRLVIPALKRLMCPRNLMEKTLASENNPRLSTTTGTLEQSSRTTCSPDEETRPREAEPHACTGTVCTWQSKEREHGLCTDYLGLNPALHGLTHVTWGKLPSLRPHLVSSEMEQRPQGEMYRAVVNIKGDNWGTSLPWYLAQSCWKLNQC